MLHQKDSSAIQAPCNVCCRYPAPGPRWPVRISIPSAQQYLWIWLWVGSCICTPTTAGPRWIGVLSVHEDVHLLLRAELGTIHPNVLDIVWPVALELIQDLKHVLSCDEKVISPVQETELHPTTYEIQLPSIQRANELPFNQTLQHRFYKRPRGMGSATHLAARHYPSERT